MVRGGNYVETAAEAAGIHLDTYYGWIERGKAGEPRYAGFSEAVARAKAQAEADMLRTAKSGDEKGASNGPAKCALSILERTRGKRFAPRVNVKVEEELTVFLDVAERVLAREDFARLCAALAAEDGSGEVAPASGSGPGVTAH